MVNDTQTHCIIIAILIPNILILKFVWKSDRTIGKSRHLYIWWDSEIYKDCNRGTTIRQIKTNMDI